MTNDCFSTTIEDATNADQIEWQAIFDGPTPLSEGLYDENIAGVFDDETASGLAQDDLMQRDAQETDMLSSTSEELRRRSMILGDAYPFVVKNDRTIEYIPKDNRVYEFCLAVARTPNLTTGYYTTLPREFERLTAGLTRCWLGEGAKAFRTGWPPEKDRPSTFKETVDMLHQASGEWIWQPSNTDYDDPGPREVKDGGVDIVAWKPFPDGRVGQVFLLGQKSLLRSCLVTSHLQQRPS